MYKKRSKKVSKSRNSRKSKKAVFVSTLVLLLVIVVTVCMWYDILHYPNRDSRIHENNKVNAIGITVLFAIFGIPVAIILIGSWRGADITKPFGPGRYRTRLFPNK